MKKTVVFEFPDDLKFPEFWGRKACDGCPFDTSMDDEPMCFLTGDCDCEYEFDLDTSKCIPRIHPNCPFFSGAETVNYSNC